MQPIRQRAIPPPQGETSPPDQELIDRIRAGDRNPFAELVRRHNQRLYRVVRAIVRDDNEAEDIVQHAHVTAYRELPSFRGEARYATWLTRIAVNEAYGRLRRRKRHGLVSLDDTDAEATMSSTSNPEDDTYHRELGRLLEQHIDDLPQGLRVVFVMREVEEIDTAETAATLGLSEAAVRVRLHRARTALQATLSSAMASAPAAFRFDGERCDRITRAVLARIARPDRS